MLHGSPLRLHPTSVLYAAPPDWLVFHESTYTAVELALNATKIDEHWLTELAPHFYTRAAAPRREAARAGEPFGNFTATMGEVASGAADGRAKRRAEAANEEDAAHGGSVAAMLGESILKAQRFF